MGLLTEVGKGPVALDSAIFIYFIERDSRFFSTVRPVFAAIAEGHLEAVTSTLTLLETLVLPLRTGNEVLARQYQRFLTQSRGLSLVPLNLSLLREAAHVRATTRLKTPDAMQVASALSAGCQVLITNDGRIPNLPPLRVLQLEDFVET